jgi:hypothetical protein
MSGFGPSVLVKAGRGRRRSRLRSFLRTLLFGFGVTTYDAVRMIAASALLLITAIAACLEPAARRAWIRCSRDAPNNVSVEIAPDD